jgi:mannose-1-phosphate guanylyltransferase
VLPRFLGRICSFHNATYHRDIGTLESLRKAELEYPRH